MNRTEQSALPLERQAKKTYSRALFNITLYALFAIVAVNIAALLTMLIGGYKTTEEMPTSLQYLLNFIPMYLIAFPLYLLISRPMEVIPPQQHRMHPLKLILAFSCCEALAIAGNLIGTLINALLTVLLGIETSSTMLEDGVFGDSGILFACIAVLCAPVIEELIFRKVLIDRIRKYGDGTAILLSGLMFGLFHGNFSQFFYAAFLGFFFAFIYIRTGKILYTITLHFLVNFFGTVMPLIVLHGVDYNEMLSSLMAGDISALRPGFVIYVVFVYSVVILGVVMLAVGYKQYRLNPPIVPLDKKTHLKAAAGNIGFWALILYCVIQFVMQILQNIK